MQFANLIRSGVATGARGSARPLNSTRDHPWDSRKSDDFLGGWVVGGMGEEGGGGGRSNVILSPGSETERHVVFVCMHLIWCSVFSDVYQVLFR